MKKIILVFLAAWAGVLAAFLTMPRKHESNTSDQVTSGEAGSASVVSASSRIANRKKAIEQMQQGIIEGKFNDSQWLQNWKLIERSGQIMGSEELKGEPYLASFFFATCPVICVQQNDQIKLLQEKFRKLPIKLVSITCDPENDTPESLANYANRIGADREKWLFFTGDWEYLKRVSAEVFFNGLDRPKEHIEKLLLVDATGKMIAEYNWHDAEELKILEADVQAICKGK